MLDWKTLNQDNYWKQNWPHPTPAGPRNSDDVTFSSVRKPPTPLRAAFPTSEVSMKLTCLLLAGATGASFRKKFH